MAKVEKAVYSRSVSCSEFHATHSLYVILISLCYEHFRIHMYMCIYIHVSLYINMHIHMCMHVRVWKASGKIVYRIISAAIIFAIFFDL